MFNKPRFVGFYEDVILNLEEFEWNQIKRKRKKIIIF